MDHLLQMQARITFHRLRCSHVHFFCLSPHKSVLVTLIHLAITPHVTKSLRLFSLFQASAVKSYQPESVNNQQLDSNFDKFNDSLSNSKKVLECPLCLMEQPVESFPYISTCKHRSCSACLQQYLSIEISESRLVLFIFYAIGIGTS